MSNDPQHPSVGDLHIDASKLVAKDLTPEQVKKAIKLRDGAITALQRVLQLGPQQLDAAGISTKEISRITGVLENHQYALELRAPTDKLSELVDETRIDSGHQIAGFLAEVAGQVRSRVERNLLDEELLAALEDLLEYQYGPAAKAMLTKARKAKAEAEQRAAQEVEQKAAPPQAQ